MIVVGRSCNAAVTEFLVCESRRLRGLGEEDLVDPVLAGRERGIDSGVGDGVRTLAGEGATGGCVLGTGRPVGTTGVERTRGDINALERAVEVAALPSATLRAICATCAAPMSREAWS